MCMYMYMLLYMHMSLYIQMYRRLFVCGKYIHSIYIYIHMPACEAHTVLPLLRRCGHCFTSQPLRTTTRPKGRAASCPRLRTPPIHVYIYIYICIHAYIYLCICTVHVYVYMYCRSHSHGRSRRAQRLRV